MLLAAHLGAASKSRSHGARISAGGWRPASWRGAGSMRVARRRGAWRVANISAAGISQRVRLASRMRGSGGIGEPGDRVNA
jgi:hypothetical protein